MTANPWLKFYPRDWRGEQALRAVSLAARGLWMEMLCVMHEAAPYGHLILGGQPVSNDVLARMAGSSMEEVAQHVAELESAGVFSRTRKGVIYSRRMVKDRQRAETGRKNVGKRWKQDVETISTNYVANSTPNTEPITQKPETRNQKQQGARAKEGDVSQITKLNRLLGFDETDYRKHNRNLRFLIDLKAEGCDFERHIWPAAEAAARNGRAETLSYIGPLARDLRRAETEAANLPVAFEDTDFQGWKDRYETYLKYGKWLEKWGQKPGDAGCRVPPEILSQERVA